MSGNELNDIIGALRKYGLKVPKSVKTPGELVVCIESQCEDTGEEEGEVQDAIASAPSADAIAEPVEMSTLSPSLRECIAEQTRLAKKHSVK